ncbi:MAG: 2,4-dienoyl-CoA reductase [Phycisphaerales bacterium]|nr:2,4-dienoyl-CoA reductase [Phycisphaerales bacterium]
MAAAQDTYPKIGHLKDVPAFRAHAASLGLDLPIDDAILSAADGSPLAQPLDVGGFVVGNRWCIHPMEGWDGNADGTPTEHTLRRWQHFGESGAKFIWGGEAFAVQEDGRANPLQIGVIDDDVPRAERGARDLLKTLLDAHRARFSDTSDLLVGLQLTHSGRFCRPRDKKKLEPKIAYHHPILDARVGIAADDDSVLLTDEAIERLIDNYVRAAKIAQRAGFGFVDVKHCHGYLGHEFLSAFTRAGKFGGDFEGRTRFAREIIGRIQSECPGLMIGVRLSAFDHPPFKPDPAKSVGGKLGPGIPEEYRQHLPYYYGFGCNPNDPLEMNLAEPIRFINMLAGLGVRMINVSCCSPYYNPHYQRPAIFPPSDGYQPPEDPLIGVERQIQAVRQLKAACPNSMLVGTGYTYLQEYCPHVAQAVIRHSWADSIGIGRLVLSYWEMPADTLAGKTFHAKKLCRTFSDCTTAPRNGIISGCYPLDPHYKEAPEHAELKAAKAELRKRLMVQQTR